jgi:potassium uptake Trk family protein
MTFLIVIGNTGFPCMLRLTIWVVSKVVREGSPVWEELRFLLDHPRRCFTLLFPSGATWWLFTILVILNSLDLIFFTVLDVNDPIITAMSPGIRFIDGLFQASSTRTAGFSVVNLAELHPAIQVSYLIMMYISVFPIAISMRRTNVYEEKSLGIYGSEQERAEDDKEPSYVGAHLRKQLSFDLWYVFLGLFIISIIEGSKLRNTNLYAFTLFSILFEIVSAYGTVGLSLGYPNINASFSAEFAVLSKLVMVAMQIRGRHRGLPYELDRAILLPSESLHEEEKEEGERIMARRRSSIAMSDTSAVEGMNPRRYFRPETGLASGHDSRMGSVRDRSHPNPTDGSGGANGGLGESHRSRVRHGLGRGLFKLASHAEVGESMEKKE